MKRLDLTGQKFGRWIVTSRCRSRLRGQQRLMSWLCYCDCGKRRWVFAGNLNSGASQSCGCLRNELIAKQGKRNATHGHRRSGKGSPEYRSWRSMLTRCENPNTLGYAFWGGRGVSICTRWHSFENFLLDMGPRPKGTTLDRFPDNDGNYEPGNVRWATAKQQRHNRRSPQKRSK